KETIRSEKFRLGELNFILCSDEYLLDINKQYLNHDTYTDIITFDTSEEPGKINADIFISIQREQENALNFKTEPTDELHRVMIHGVLHLVGYPDKTSPEKKLMRSKEDEYLAIRNF